MSEAPRAVAIRALVRIEDGAFANVALPAALRATTLDSRGRAQVTDLVYGTVRWQRTLDHFLTPYVDRPVRRMDPPVRAALRLGAFQLWSGVPAHAAVGETVAAVQAVAPRAKGFVNAVLRTLAANGPPWPLPDGSDAASVGVRASLPDWIVERLDADLGPQDAAAVLDVVNEPPTLTLRVNPLRATADAVEAELRDAGVAVARGALIPDALLVTGGGDVRDLPAVRDGRATPQDQASQAVRALVGAVPGDQVLDVGAAPGGKSTALAEAMGDRGLVVAVDRHAGRTRMIGAAADRLGLASVRPVVADGARLPFGAGRFDRVLVDAPCSGLGVLRRRPEARWRLRPEAIDELAALQRELLLAAAAAVRPGGRVVYSVCTLSRAETVAIDEWAETALPDFRAVEPPGAPWQRVGRGARLLPSAADTDGMYCLSLAAPG
ncbi:MAG: 16S rRNA (cytosine(967)-C(5))-methyltransferase RsmB [Acidimicrobiia bacterium]